MINLFDESSRKAIAGFIKSNSGRLQYQEDIFTILEGNLKELLEKKMIDDLGPKSYEQAKTREAPINVFKKIIDKLTRIYNQTVIRTVSDGTDSDLELVRWYEKELSLNRKMAKNNANFNTYLYSLLQIGLSEAKDPMSSIRDPFIRSIPNHQFLIMNDSPTDPTSPDVIIVCMPKYTDENGVSHGIFWVYTDYQFIIMNQSGEIMEYMMRGYEMDGINMYGTTPFAYANNSEDCVMPSIQSDNKDMSLLIPLLLTDLNYAVKFQAFSVFYGIDIQDTQVTLSPNSIMLFETKPGGDSPSFNVIKPTVDISETLNLASSQMSLWLSSKGIRPGTVGQIGVDSFASGISKMIDESDTYEAIKEQINIFTDFEEDFWEKLLFDMHPKWVAAGVIDNKTIFSPGARVITKFTTPVPLQSRGELVKDLESEVAAGFISVKRAVQMLNPEMDDAEIDQLIADIQGDRPKIVGVNNGPQYGNAANA